MIIYPILCASSATLTKLSMAANGDVLMKLAGIELPFLHNLALSISRENEMSRVNAAAFIAAQRAVKTLRVSGKVGPLPVGTLPNLQELDASIELVKQLVPGRPVEEIYIISHKGNDQDWYWEETAKSTAVVRKLYLGAAILDIAMAEKMVTRLPFVEKMRLAVHGDVRWFLSLYTVDSFFPFQTLLNIIEVLTSLKRLTQLKIDLFRDNSKVCVNRDIISAIATNLRKANSYFSTIEIWDRWKHIAFVWNEVLGVFQHDAESESVL
jgi:hypothetical protein